MDLFDQILQLIGVIFGSAFVAQVIEIFNLLTAIFGEYL